MVFIQLNWCMIDECRWIGVAKFGTVELCGKNAVVAMNALDS